MGDPDGEDDSRERPSQRNNLERALSRYLAITHEIGLWHYKKLLQVALDALDTGTMPPPQRTEFPETANIIHPQRRTYASGRYIGRAFSSLVHDIIAENEYFKRSPMPSERRALDALARKNLGLYSFVGVHESVLRAIHDARWHDLIHIDIAALDETPGNVTLDPDGTVVESVVATPGTAKGDEIIASLSEG